MKSPHVCYSTQKSIEIAIDDLIVARFPTPQALRDNVEMVTTLLSSSIELFALRTGIKTTHFEEAYSAAVRMTFSTLNKGHLSGVCRFKKLPIKVALRWLKSRLVNNFKTALTNPNSKEWLGHAERHLIMSEHTVTFGNAEVEAELAGLSREQVVGGLRTMFLDGADVGELEYLCDRFGIKLSDIIGVYNIPVIVERSPQGSPQLAFDFEEEV